MDIYISRKIFYTKCIDRKSNQEMTYGVIPGLQFKLLSIENDIALLENIDSKTKVIVTKDMLFSELFVKD